MTAPRLVGLVLACALLGAPGHAADGLPLEPARAIAFEVDEGTWMSVDVSPDGGTIVFDLLGDLYTVPITGGAARRIQGGMAFDAQPVYAPDGGRIAFVSDRSGAENLWIANADGSEPRMLSANVADARFSSPAWAADGSAVYVSRRVGRHGVFELWQHHLAGGAGLRIEDETAPGHALGAAPSADGRFLYYAAKSTAAATLYVIPAWSIARRDLETGQTRQMVTAPGTAWRPRLSPDGRTLIYGTRHDGETGLRLRDLASGEDRWLAYPVQRDNRDGKPLRDILPGYAVTPDGKAVIAAHGGKIRRIDMATGAATVVPFTADVELGIGPSLIRDRAAETGPVRARLIQNPVQSPDGRRLAFSALARLYVARLEDGEVRRVTESDDPAFQPAWSPDGRRLAYVTWEAAGSGHVWTVPARGGRAKRLTDVAAFYSDPVFSPDGRWVYALASSTVERMRLQEEVTPRRFADLVRIPAAGGPAEVLTHVGTGRRPFVTGEPERVFYTTPEGVTSVAANDGSDARVHLRIDGLHDWTNAGAPHPVDDAVISPDGRWALAIAANQLHLVAVPPPSDDVPVVNLVADTELPAVQVSRFGADYYGWADGGRTVTWALGSTYYRQPLDAALSGEQTAEAVEIRVEVPRDRPEGAVLFRGATVITMNGDEVLADADLLVAGARIAGLGRRGAVDVPAGAHVVDVSGAFITPGFVDTHAHWYEIRHDVLDLWNWSFLSTLAFGITSGLDVQAMDQDMFAYQDLLDAGLMIGPRAWSVGKGMFANNRLDSAADADDLLARYADHYRTLNVKAYLSGNRRQRQWIVQAAAKHGLVPTTEGDFDLKLGLTHAIDGFAGNEHAPFVVPLYDDVVRLFAETGIAYTPTLMIVSSGGSTAKEHFFITQPPHNDPKVRRFMPHFVSDIRSSPARWVRPEEWLYPRVAASVAKVLRAGGRVGIGSHAEFQGLAFHWEMEALAAGGLTPAELLRAATEMGAGIIGRAQDIGTIEAGKFADLVVLDRNPLDDIRNARALRYVMKNGRLYDADTLNEIWPRARKLPPLWHHERPPQ